MSLIAWAILSVIGIYWYPLHGSSAQTMLFAIAIGCFANWARNRSFHCIIIGPLFFIAALMFLLSDLHVIHVNASVLWGFVFAGIAMAFLMEWRFARRSEP